MGCGGGSGGPDYEGYAAYLNAEVRDDPITAQELRDTAKGDPECDEDILALSWGLTRTAVEPKVAAAYFECGADTARNVVRSKYNAEEERELLRFIDEDLPTYGN